MSLFLLLPVLLSGAGFVQAAPAKDATVPLCPDNARWSDPTPPLNIFGNTWYVGTCGIASLLITGDDGHVLIDGATPEAGAMIVQSIRALGFDPKDVRLLLNTHEHVDHAGGLATLQAATGAPLRARAPGLIALRKGDMDFRDPQLASRIPSFPPIKIIERLEDNAVVRIGNLSIQSHATPGHSLGGTSFTWRSCEADVCREMAFADSLSAVAPEAYRFSNPAANPSFVPMLRQTFAAVAALPCDVLITPHPSASRLWYRVGPEPSEALVDPTACRRYAEAGAARLDTRLSSETPTTP